MSRTTNQRLTVAEPVAWLIQEIRGERVMLDVDLVRIYGVPTKRLNEQVRRNASRFPSDCAFVLRLRKLVTWGRKLRPQAMVAAAIFRRLSPSPSPSW